MESIFYLGIFSNIEQILWAITEQAKIDWRDWIIEPAKWRIEDASQPIPFGWSEPGIEGPSYSND